MADGRFFVVYKKSATVEQFGGVVVNAELREALGLKPCAAAGPRVVVVLIENWLVVDGNLAQVSITLLGKVDDTRIQMDTFKFGAMTTNID